MQKVYCQRFVSLYVCVYLLSAGLYVVDSLLKSLTVKYMKMRQTNLTATQNLQRGLMFEIICKFYS